MSGKGSTGLSEASILALTWAILSKFYERKHVSGTPKLKDFKDSKYATKKGIRKEAVMADIPQEATNIIRDRIRNRIIQDPNENKESRAQNIVGSLIGDNSFLQSVSNIFTPSFTGITPQPSDVKEEQQPQPEDEDKPTPSKKITTKKEEQQPQQKIKSSVLEEMNRNISTPEIFTSGGIGLTAAELKAAKLKRGKPIKSVEKIKPTKAEKDKAMIEDAITNVLKQEEISTKKNITTGFEEMGQRLDNINKILEQDPVLKSQFKNIEKKIERTPISGGSDMKIDQKQINQIIDNIPSEYREVLRPSVRSLLGGGRGLDANTIASGILALTLTSIAGPLAGTIGSSVANYMRKSFNIDLNDYVFAEAETPTPPEREPEPEPERPTPTKKVVPPLVKPKQVKPKKEEKQKEEKKQEDQKDIYASGWMPYKQPIGLDATTQKLKTWLEMHENEYMNPSVPNIGGMAQKSVDYYEARLEEYIRRQEQKIKDPSKPQERTDDKQRKMTDTDEEEIKLFASDGEEPQQPEPVVYRNLRPRREDVEQGAGIGAVVGAGSSGLFGLGGISAQRAMGGIVTGAAAGAAGRALSISALRNFYIRRGQNPDDPAIRKRIKYLSTIPAASAAALIGYKKTGQDITSGAGITEKKIIVDSKVLSETQAQLDQEPSKNKQWIPKAIQPSTSILDQSQQERYADDLEFVAFNYIAPTSEGAQGDINTNPLKRQQYVGDEIRYSSAGVFIPYDTWNQINDTNDISEQRIREMALGQKPLVPLPDMRFVPQDNETTFENMAEYHYVNNENTAIEYQSPYSDYSDVRNYWSINEESELFTINP